MNETLRQFARTELKKGLAQCTDAQCQLFKRMYARGQLELPVNDVVDRMNDDKLDCAMMQVETTLRKAAMLAGGREEM